MNVCEAGVRKELSRRGVLSSRELQSALGVSQPTMARTLAALSPTELVCIGRARATRYGLRRDIRGLGSTWPLYRIAENGRASVTAHLHALAQGEWFLEEMEASETLRGNLFPDGVYPDLPWFLQDLRPRGFLGRCLAHRCADQFGTPRDPRDWSSDDVVHGLVACGGDLSGAFVLGRRALEAAKAMAQDPRGRIAFDARQEQYPARADAVMGDQWPGSSAAGEQPKFTACLAEGGGAICPVIVKFSGAVGRPEDRRWADLLIAEHVANEVLAEAGIPCAKTSLLVAAGRTFLESRRFDRTAAGGRRGLVSLEAFDNTFFGAIDTSWMDAARRYRDAGWLASGDADRLTLLWRFGAMIGNTDMHYGNVSLFFGDVKPLALAPTYDMVPMQYRPDIEGRLPAEAVAPSLPSPEVASLGARAASLARAFWERMSREEPISPDFRNIASRNARVVADLGACREVFS